MALAPSGALLAVLLAASDRALRDPENHRERMAFFVLAVSFITLADLLAAMLAGEAFWHRNRKDWVPTLVRWAAYLVLALATAGSVYMWNRNGKLVGKLSAPESGKRQPGMELSRSSSPNFLQNPLYIRLVHR